MFVSLLMVFVLEKITWRNFVGCGYCICFFSFFVHLFFFSLCFLCGFKLVDIIHDKYQRQIWSVVLFFFVIFVSCFVYFVCLWF